MPLTCCPFKCVFEAFPSTHFLGRQSVTIFLLKHRLTSALLMLILQFSLLFSTSLLSKKRETGCNKIPQMPRTIYICWRLNSAGRTLRSFVRKIAYVQLRYMVYIVLLGPCGQRRSASPCQGWQDLSWRFSPKHYLNVLFRARLLPPYNTQQTMCGAPLWTEQSVPRNSTVYYNNK